MLALLTLITMYSLSSIHVIGILSLHILTTSAYHISSIPLSYNDAINYCQNNYNTTLATIYSPQQNDLIASLCSSTSTNHDCWIGLKYDNNTNHWKWIKNDISVGYQSFLNNPTNPTSKCGLIYKDDNKWDNALSTDLNLPICNEGTVIL